MESMVRALALVFVAELGDKTQLVALGFGARYGAAVVVAGLAAGYGAANIVSVVAGSVLGVSLPDRALGIGGGLLFLAFAAWTLWSAEDDQAGGHRTAAGLDRRPIRSGGPAVAGSVAAAIFVAEMGDKTMLATATLASQGDPVWVWLGATVGEVGAGVLGVVAGRLTGARLSERLLRVGSAVLFAVFGVVLLVTNL